MKPKTETLRLTFAMPNFNIKYLDSFFNEKTFKLSAAPWVKIPESNNVIIDCEVPKHEIAKHSGTFSLKYLWRGEEIYETSKGVFSVKPDRFLLLNEGTNYSSRVLKNEMVETFSLHFNSEYWKTALSTRLNSDDELLNNPFSNNGDEFYFSEELYEIDYSCLALCREISNSLKLNNPNLANELIALLMDNVIFSQKEIHSKISLVQSKKTTTKIEIYKRLTLAKDYMLSCYGEEITLEQLGFLTAMSPFHFLRHFKRYFHQTPHQFLTEIRLQEALKLLKQTEKNVSEVCLAVGFADLSSFSKLFKRRFGFPPSKKSIFAK